MRTALSLRASPRAGSGGPSFRGEAGLATFAARIAHNIGVFHVRRAVRERAELHRPPDRYAPRSWRCCLFRCRGRWPGEARDRASDGPSQAAASIGIICGQLALIALGLFTDKLPSESLALLVAVPMLGIGLMAANAEARRKGGGRGKKG